MKRLFQIKTQRKGQPLPLYFSDKMEAKRMRNELNREGATTVVAYGPDHKLYKENNNAS